MICILKNSNAYHYLKFKFKFVLNQDRSPFVLGITGIKVVQCIRKASQWDHLCSGTVHHSYDPPTPRQVSSASKEAGNQIMCSWIKLGGKRPLVEDKCYCPPLRWVNSDTTSPWEPWVTMRTTWAHNDFIVWHDMFSCLAAQVISILSAGLCCAVGF